MLRSLLRELGRDSPEAKTSRHPSRERTIPSGGGELGESPERRLADSLPLANYDGNTRDVR